MTRQLPDSVVWRAVGMLEAGRTQKEVAQVLGISPSTVSKWKRQMEETGSPQSGPSSSARKRQRSPISLTSQQTPKMMRKQLVIESTYNTSVHRQTPHSDETRSVSVTERRQYIASGNGSRRRTIAHAASAKSRTVTSSGLKKRYVAKQVHRLMGQSERSNTVHEMLNTNNYDGSRKGRTLFKKHTETVKRSMEYDSCRSSTSRIFPYF